MRLKGKVALVTGAADERSIGWGIARALAEEGADVAVNDLRHDGRMSQRIEDLAALGVRGLAAPADVSKPDQVDAMFERTVSHFGRIDIVASNAGVIHWEHFLDITPAKLQAIVDVNLKGNVNVCRAAAQHMIGQGEGGRIIITSSVHANRHFPDTLVYDATKHAMHIFVGCLAVELAPYNITVNHFGPGWVKSALNDAAPSMQNPQALTQAIAEVPLKRDGSTWEMGRAVVYFASDDGAYTTGAYLCVDGGLGVSKYTL